MLIHTHTHAYMKDTLSKEHAVYKTNNPHFFILFPHDKYEHIYFLCDLDLYKQFALQPVMTFCSGRHLILLCVNDIRENHVCTEWKNDHFAANLCTLFENYFKRTPWTITTTAIYIYILIYSLVPLWTHQSVHSVDIISKNVNTQIHLNASQTNVLYMILFQPIFRFHLKYRFSICAIRK